MDQTPNLALPYIASAQAQKHVTHNEAIRALDALVQLAVIDRDLTTPPTTPANGDRYIVGPSPSGAWLGHANKIAAWQDGAWAFLTPREGWLAWVADEDQLYAFTGSAWAPATTPALNPVPLVGINTTADTTNRLAVSSAASLFNHAGAGHQLKLNKAADTDTAALLFQTGFSGRAEIGTAGDDTLRFKVSADGNAWKSPIAVASDGHITVSEPVTVASTTPILVLDDIDAAADCRLFDIRANANVFFIRAVNDANTSANPILSATRSGITVTAVDLGGPVSSNGAIAPSTDNTHTCGTAAKRWTAVHATNGVIQTSDARDKHVERILAAEAGRMVDAVNPVLYRWRDDAKPDTPRALHAGFLAQDIKAAMNRNDLDFAAWGVDDASDPMSRQHLRPDQLIPVLWAALKQTRATLSTLTRNTH
jgi:hypothetical protein